VKPPVVRLFTQAEPHRSEGYNKKGDQIQTRNRKETMRDIQKAADALGFWRATKYRNVKTPIHCSEDG